MGFGDVFASQVSMVPVFTTRGWIALKKMVMCCKNHINKLRDELHNLIETENLNSSIVQKRSQELDDLILMYYRQIKKDQELKEP